MATVTPETKPAPQPPVEASKTPTHDTVAPKSAAAPAGLEVAERKVDATREAVQRAAMLDHARRMEPGQWTPLPNGEQVRVQGAVGMKYPGEKATDMLARPRDMLYSPKADFYTPNGQKIGDRYQWRVRTSVEAKDNRPAETANLHRAQRIRYVETSEIDPRSEISVYTEYATANNVYVTYMSLILCEILDERLAYQTYKGWEDRAIARVVNFEDTVRGERELGATRIEGKTEVDVTIKDTRRGG